MTSSETIITTLEYEKQASIEVGLNCIMLSNEFVDKIITLLKNQKEVKPTTTVIDEHCGRCGNTLAGDGKDCPFYGQDCRRKINGY